MLDKNKKLLFGVLLSILLLCGCANKPNNDPQYCADGEHIESEWGVISEATCTVDGLEGIVCETCGKVLESKVIKATGHTEVIDEAVEATCDKIGLTEGSHCSKCEAVIKEQELIPNAHHYVVIDSKEATTEEEGYITYKCDKCQKEYTDIINKIGVYNPEDPTKIYLVDDHSSIDNDNGGVQIEGNVISISLAGEYTFSGTLTNGNIIVNVGEEDKVTINLNGVEITSKSTHVIYIEQANKVNVSAKAETINKITDSREYDEEGTGGAIYACCDLDIQGKGTLIVSASYNNGICTKDDLDIKNCILEVTAPNNALKGNDSITIESGTIKAISTKGDALKTDNTDLTTKGKQKGTITIEDGKIDLYAACDGIDASYDAIINGGEIRIYTDSNSEYSEEVTATSSSKLYLRLPSRNSSLSTNNKYSALLIDAEGKETWASGTLLDSGMNKYYEFSKSSTAKYVKFYVYTSSQTINQKTTYAYASDQLTLTSSMDCYSISNASGQRISGQWSNYSTQSWGGGYGGNRPGGGGPGGGGPGGGNEGNSDKADYSCKGIKADNAIQITGGTITVKAHDDAIHANSDVTLESTSKNGLGNVTITGGTLELYTDDDGIHGDGTVSIEGGNIVITNSYEGVEGNIINFKNGTTQIASSDDGINAINQLNISGGLVYLNANGDGIDSNNAVTMTGGIVLALGPTNGGNGVIDFDRTFSFSGGLLLAIGCSGMNQKPTASTGNTSQSKTISTSTSSYVHVTVGGEIVATIKVTKSSQNYCVLAYNNTTYPSASVTVNTTNSNELVNGYYYVK